MRRTALCVPPFEGVEYVHWRHGHIGDADADGIGDGVADGGADGDGRRFAEPDDAALIVDLADIQVDDDIADVLDAGELVELHVGVHHAPGGVVHDPLFIEGGGDAHDDGAVDLALGQARVDEQAAILHGHVAVDFDEAGFGIDADVGHLHAGSAAAVEAHGIFRFVGAGLADLATGTDLLASRDPGHALLGVALDADGAVDGFQFLGLRGERRGGRFENLGEGVDAGFAGGRGGAADGGGTAGGSNRRQAVIADDEFDLAHLEAEGFGGHLGHDGARAGAQILGAHLDQYRAIGVDGGAGRAGVARAAPSADAEAETAAHRAFLRAARLPEFAPFGQLGSLLQLVLILLGARRVAGVFVEDHHGVHADFSGEVFDGRAGEVGCLLVIGRAPCLRGAGIHGDGHVVKARVGDIGVDVRQGRLVAAGETAGGPGIGLPAGDGAVLLAGDFDFAEGAGTVAGDLLFGGAIEEDLDRLAARFLGEAGADFGPRSGAEFAAEAAADVIHLDLDIGDRDLDVGRQVGGPSGNELGGRPRLDLIALPLDHAAVGFQAAVGDHRDAVYAVGDGLGILQGFLEIAGDFLAGGLATRRGLGEVGFVDEVRHDFVNYVDLADGFARYFLGGGSHGGHFLAVPLEFLASLGDDVYRFDADYLLRRAGIDGGDAGMAVGASEVGRVQHVLHLQVGGVLGAG